MGGQGLGGGIDIAAGPTSLKDTKVVGNKATAGDNIDGTPATLHRPL